MPYRGQTSLIRFLNFPFIQASTRKPLGGEEYLRLSDVLKLCAYQYQMGALLGYARREKLSLLVEMLAPTFSEEDFAKRLTERAKKRLVDFGHDFNREPNTFDEFVMLERIDNALRGIGCVLSDDRYACSYTDKGAKKALDTRFPNNFIVRHIDYCLAEGILFGSSYPELTKRMYETAKHNEEASVAPELHGLRLPETICPICFDEAQEAVLQLVAMYVSEFYPGLVSPLALENRTPPH